MKYIDTIHYSLIHAIEIGFMAPPFFLIFLIQKTPRKVAKQNTLDKNTILVLTRGRKPQK